jgi:hypothetical protein
MTIIDELAMTNNIDILCSSRLPQEKISSTEPTMKILPSVGYFAFGYPSFCRRVL